ncbi:hypothetical protein B0H14DRAFT_1382156 [Mycena olivaceomarginata]|nr:hypothetical protein B0H14DRAFT_1382156 [Mycena olivaceomarginata]
MLYSDAMFPWRWTTPIVLCASLFISGFLAAINVPLSAYEVVQEVTYRPNDTLPPLPLSNFIPAILQHPASSFTPADPNCREYTYTQQFSLQLYDCRSLQ